MVGTLLFLTMAEVSIVGKGDWGDWGFFPLNWTPRPFGFSLHIVVVASYLSYLWGENGAINSGTGVDRFFKFTIKTKYVVISLKTAFVRTLLETFSSQYHPRPLRPRPNGA
jgi:hypothetical protein